ncbi:nucleotide-sugar transporter-domain-containing protein [Xylogone sp. PMI_703]|nr:nucleotide-sugar transporter-domain-containing protein [Xylogone sp. PMI_703]
MFLPTGVPAKYLVFILTLHYTRVISVTSQTRYLTSTVVLLVELVKLVVSLGFTFHEQYQSTPSLSFITRLKTVVKLIFTGDSYKLSIPAILYTLQNYLIYASISNLSATTFQVTYQLKILTTVLFSVMLLRKRLSSTSWFSLVLLTVGIAVVQIPQSSQLSFVRGNHDDDYGTKIAGQTISAASAGMKNHMNTSRGLAAVFGASIISGFTGVYFEQVIKETLTSVSIWTRNAQLSFYSLVSSFLIGIIYKDGGEIYRNGFFAGYTGLVWITIVLQSLGGLTVAICIMELDNVVKNFAVSISIVVNFLVDVLIFKSPVTFNCVCGISIVLLATYLYSRAYKANINLKAKYHSVQPR